MGTKGESSLLLGRKVFWGALWVQLRQCSAMRPPGPGLNGEQPIYGAG